MSTHETDFYTWTQEQAALFRQGRLAEVDVENIIDEIESLGASQRQQLYNRLRVLLAHLLKWQYEPERRGNSWRLTIEEQRKRTSLVLRQNPGLKPSIGEVMEDAYDVAILRAARETKLKKSTFPIECPCSFAQVMDADFWPTAPEYQSSL